jgi:hypothetical protein
MSTLPFRAQMVAAFLALGMFVIAFDLVRRRRLREEYSLLWIAVTASMALLAFWGDLLITITRLVGAYSANSVIFLFGLGFLTLVSLHYSMRLSDLTARNKDLAQALAILRSTVEALSRPAATGHVEPSRADRDQR